MPPISDRAAAVFKKPCVLVRLWKDTYSALFWRFLILLGF